MIERVEPKFLVGTAEDIERSKTLLDARNELADKINAIPYWYHRIELPHGIVTPGWAPINQETYGIPDDLSKCDVLDLGAWDGFWTLEAIKRGANLVVAVDDFSDTLGSVHNVQRRGWEPFELCLSASGFKPVQYWWQNERGQIVDTYELSVESDDMQEIAAIDHVFCFGLLYHLCNPLKALQNCFDATKSGGWIHVETAILDNLQSPFTGKPHDPNGCYAEFYPGEEFGKNKSNWWVPTLKCAAAWLQAVGYVDIEGWKLTEKPQSLAECRGFLRARKPAS